MEKKDLLKYLTDCKELELTIYNLQREQEMLYGQINALGNAYQISQPDKYTIRQKVKVEGFWPLIVSLIIVVISVFIIALHYGMYYGKDDILIGIIVFVIWLIIAGAIGWVVAMIIIKIIDIIANIVTNIRIDNQYEIEMSNYNKALQQDQNRIANENAQKPILQSRINDIERQKNETTNALNQLYAVGIIYPKYHALVPIVMFCEYIESGRCDALEGHEGAYNIYENELRQNIIISKLDAVINKLDQIRQNQYMLAAAIEEGNRHVAQLCSAAKESAQRLERIETNSVITAENARIAANNTYVIGKLEAYRMMFGR